eukprot:2755081-Rhodomonas_salina.1
MKHRTVALQPQYCGGAVDRVYARYEGVGGRVEASPAIGLRARCVMSGTDIAYGAVCAVSLRLRYAMPGTDIAYGATRKPEWETKLVRAVEEAGGEVLSDAYVQREMKWEG